MSSPKSFVAEEDPEVLRRRAEELMRREQARHDELIRTPRDQLNEEDRQLCERVEARNRELHAISSQQCELLGGQARDLLAKLSQAANSRATVSAKSEGFALPPLPAAITDTVLSSGNPADIQSELDRLKAELEAYERTYAKARQEHVARINQGTMHTDAMKAAGIACYASELESQADLHEQRAVGQIKAELRRQRAEADDLIAEATATRQVPLSSGTLETYREILASSEVSSRAAGLHRLRHALREDAQRHIAQEEERKRLESERRQIDKRLVLVDVCRQMGWRVFDGLGEQSDRIYVSEGNFSNHLRELRLEQDASGKTRLSLQTVEIEGASRRKPDPQLLSKEHKDFDLALCGKGGSLLAFMERLRANAIALKDMREEFPPPPKPYPLANLPADVRGRLNPTEASRPLEKSAPPPSNRNP